MPRKPRFTLPDLPMHIVQRGNNRQAIFFADEDRRAYLGWLAEAAERWGCAVHAYVLMSNHVHLLVTPSSAEGVSRMMQYLGRQYVPYINRRHQRTGSLWEGRYRASLVQTDRYLLACSRYIERNPVRAGLVSTPGEHPWSSHAHNAFGVVDALVTEHPVYTALGATPQLRQQAYRDLFKDDDEGEATTAIRACLQSGTPLGDNGFHAGIAGALGRAVGQTKRGRPRKQEPATPTADPGQGKLPGL